VQCRSTACFAREVEDQGSGNLTLNHFSVEDRSTNHRFGPYIDHDSSMRTSRRRAGAKVENVFCFPRRVFCAVFCTGPFRDARAPNQLNVKLNEPLPKGAHFDLRISPISADEEIALGSGEAVDASQRVFRVSGTLPEGAVPGEWHIAVICLFLPGSGWTHRTIAPNDLKFEVEGKPYPIPTTAEVTVGH
jgi:hypothetical protein